MTQAVGGKCVRTEDSLICKGKDGTISIDPDHPEASTLIFGPDAGKNASTKGTINGEPGVYVPCDVISPDGEHSNGQAEKGIYDDAVEATNKLDVNS